MQKDIILLHGALGTSYPFRELAETLGSDYSVHTFDFKGHGGDMPDERFGISQFADQVLAFISSKEIKMPYVFGFSMGGYVALYAELQHPGTFAGIFTLATKFDWTPENAERETAFLKADKIREKTPQYASYLEKLHGETWTATLDATVKLMLQLGDKPLLTKDELGRINIPCLISIGSEDAMVSIRESREYAAVIPDAEFRVWEGMVHPFEKVETAFIAERIKNFTENVEAVTSTKQ